MQHLIDICINCITEEAEFWPCLGLISKKDPGCHTDMDINTFYKSITVFRPYLNEINLKQNTINTFNDLQVIGIKYENLMFDATNGINTHKGLVFSLSIFYYALLKTQGKDIQNFISDFCKPLELSLKNKDTKGLQAFHNLNFKTARHMALSGYDVVFKVYNEYKTWSLDIKNSKYVNTILLLKLTHSIDDTTMFSKIGIDKYLSTKIIIENLLIKILSNSDSSWEEDLLSFNAKAIQDKISPGGAADLLVLVLILININF